MIRRVRAFIMWLLYFVTPTDLYLKINGYNPDSIGLMAENLFKDFEGDK